MQKFAQRMRAQKQMKAATEPYVAYGATEDLFRACARAGEYTMPTVAEGEEPLRSAKGEDLGVGSGWWYEGNTLFHIPALDEQLADSSIQSWVSPRRSTHGLKLPTYTCTS
jgi:hypothetical protein